MRRMFPRPMGDVSRRLNGVIRQLQTRAKSAREMAAIADSTGQAQFAASLRGKARGYGEAIDLLTMLDVGLPIRRRNRWSPAMTDRPELLGLATPAQPHDETA